jgi:hypothetical protein
MTNAYSVGLVVARRGLSEHQARQLADLMRAWCRYAGVFRLHVWGGTIEPVWEHIAKDKPYGFVVQEQGVPACTRLRELDEVYCFPARTRTLSNPDLPLSILMALQGMNYTHARRIDAWTNEYRPRGGR